MSPSKLKRAVWLVKDGTSIGLAKVAGSHSIADLDVAIVKSTRHDENPPDDKYYREILSLTTYSKTYVSACVDTISRRLSKTKNAMVALKTLVLIQRLLTEGDPAFEQDIFFSTRRGSRFLNMSDFRDISHSNSWDFSAFVRTYALYLDERLELRMQGRRGNKSALKSDGYEDNSNNQKNIDKGNTAASTPVHEMKIDLVFSRVQNLQQLLERFLACRPTGAAKNNKVVAVALYPIVKESFHTYYQITEVMGVLIDRFMELEVQDCIKTYDIFVRIAKQFDDLDAFYIWCMTAGIARTPDYPAVERITEKKLQVMDDIIRERITEKKLQVMDDIIREKPLLAQKKMMKETEDKEKDTEEKSEDEDRVVKDDNRNAGKALPVPPPEEVKEEKEIPEKPKEDKKANNEADTTATVQLEGDLLSLGDEQDDAETSGDKLALVLFDGGSSGNANSASPWEVFGNNRADWETALVQPTSPLSGQKPELAGGLCMLFLDGMYQHQAAASRGYAHTGSNSSIALGSVGRPAMLAMPATPGSLNSNSFTGYVDPFAESLVVAQPPYVQMSEMEQKQRMLMQEQIMWQQFERNRMQGGYGLASVQANHSYNVGGNTNRF